MPYSNEQNAYDYTQGQQQQPQPSQQPACQQAQPVQGGYVQPPYQASQQPYAQQPYAAVQSPAEPITGGQKALYCILTALIPLVSFIMLLVADTAAGPEGAYRAKVKWAAIGAIIGICLVIIWSVVSTLIGVGTGLSSYRYYY